MQTAAASIRCRSITEADVEGVVNLLVRGFKIRPRQFWARALQRIKDHQSAPDYPKYGYLLERDGAVVGVLLLIFTTMPLDGGSSYVRGSVSSWYVDPVVRSHASMLASRALKHKEVTYINVSPVPHTVPILEAQGYRRFSSGVFACPAALASSVPGCSVTLAGPGLSACPDLRAPDLSAPDLSSDEIELLQTHQAWGCISLVCTVDGRRTPFVFLRRTFRGVLPYACLIYCRHVDDVVHFAGPLGSFLAKRGLPLMLIDGDEPIKGLPGRYFANKPKFFKGPHRPRLGDLAYTEMVILGL